MNFKKDYFIKNSPGEYVKKPGFILTKRVKRDEIITDGSSLFANDLNNLNEENNCQFKEINHSEFLPNFNKINEGLIFANKREKSIRNSENKINEDKILIDFKSNNNFKRETNDSRDNSVISNRNNKKKVGSFINNGKAKQTIQELAQINCQNIINTQHCIKYKDKEVFKPNLFYITPINGQKELRIPFYKYCNEFQEDSSSNLDNQKNENSNNFCFQVN